MATYRHWSVSLWQDPDDVSHCWILSPDKTEWQLISATLCRKKSFFWVHSDADFNKQKTWTVTRNLETRILWFSRKMKLLTKTAQILSKKNSRSDQRAVSPFVISWQLLIIKVNLFIKRPSWRKNINMRGSFDKSLGWLCWLWSYVLLSVAAAITCYFCWFLFSSFIFLTLFKVMSSLPRIFQLNNWMHL